MRSSAPDRLAGARASLRERVRQERARLAALAKVEPVRVEDWTLYAAEGEHWVRDLDLAERAELAKPRDVRTTIEKGIKDGLMSSAAAAGATKGPVVRVEKVLVPKGNRGGTQEVTQYYLNEEAALLLVTRLRTPKAIELTKAIVRVFLAVTRGQVASVPASPPPAAPLAPPGNVGKLAEVLIAALHVKLATIEEQQNTLLEAMRQLIEGNTYVTPAQAACIQGEALSLMEKWVTLGWAPNKRSAAQAIRPYVYSQVIWDGTPQIAKYLPKVYYESVRRALERQHWIADESLRRLGLLPGSGAEGGAS